MAIAQVRLIELAEWLDLQERFENAYMAAGAPAEVALFSRNRPGGPVEMAVFAPADRVSRFTIGDGWSTREVEGEGWGLLVGRANAADTFGVIIGHESSG